MDHAAYAAALAMHGMGGMLDPNPIKVDENGFIVTKPCGSRWSTQRYHNPAVPAYIPPELVIAENGTPLEAILLRARIEDAKRMLDCGNPELYFQRKDGPVKFKPEYARDTGKRLNTYEKMLEDRRDAMIRDLQERNRRFKRDSLGVGLSGKREIVKKIYFTETVIEMRSYGAIIGARGLTHQKITRDTGCHIVLAGRGITDMKKEINLRHIDESAEMAEERPHCRITAPSETALQKAVEMVEWILSDDPEAIAKRDENRKALALLNGTFREETWEQNTEAYLLAQKRGAAMPQTVAKDKDDVDELFDGITD